MPSFKLQAIILARQDFGESDRLLSIYSLENGREQILAKGVRKTLSKLGGFLEQFSQVEIVISRGASIPILSEVSTLKSFKNLRQHLESIQKANYLSQIIQRFTPQEEENPELFKLLMTSILFLSENLAAELVPAYFSLTFLKIHGLAPNLAECGECGQALNENEVYFPAPYDSFICKNCKPDTQSKLTPQSAKLLKLMLNKDLDFLSKLQGLDPTTVKTVTDLSKKLLSFHFEQEVN